MLGFYIKKKKKVDFDQKCQWFCFLETCLYSLCLYFRRIIYLFWELFIKFENKLSYLEMRYLRSLINSIRLQQVSWGILWAVHIQKTWSNRVLLKQVCSERCPLILYLFPRSRLLTVRWVVWRKHWIFFPSWRETVLWYFCFHLPCYQPIKLFFCSVENHK